MKYAELKTVHIGEEIKKVLDESKMSKTEFGRLIDTPQQHVNRIFEREVIDTGKLVKICRALNVNFFALYCERQSTISAYLSAIALGDGDAQNLIGETAALTELEVRRVKLENSEKTERDLREQIKDLRDNVAQLKKSLEDKEKLIQEYKKH